MCIRVSCHLWLFVCWYLPRRKGGAIWLSGLNPSNWSLEALIAENPFALFNSVFHFFDFNSDFLHSCLLWHKITISGVSSFWSRWRDAMTTGYDSSCMHVMCTVLATGL